jgi:hypothetical protein
LVECHPTRLMLVDVHLVGGKERLLVMWIYLHMNDGLFQEGRESANIDGERAPLARLGWPPNSCEEVWRKCAHE